MKHLCLLLILSLLLCGCQAGSTDTDIAATTLPVYQFTQWLCQGTKLTVSQLIQENVSCLHDYSLSIPQAKLVESAELVVMSGAGLEDFMEDLLSGKKTIDSSQGISLLNSCSEHGHGHDHDHDHSHESDSHIWLSTENARKMAANICTGLCQNYPQFQDQFEVNLSSLLAQIDALEAYGKAQLSSLSCRELITFHDGFAYFADSFDLQILAAVEEESGSEASALELKELIALVQEHHLPAIFTERNGSVSAADVIARETGADIYTLDMAMSGNSWFDAMYRNINTVKEALG